MNVLYVYIYNIIIYIHIWWLFKIVVPENCPYAALSRTFRAPAESGQGIMIMFSCAYFVIKIHRRIVSKTRKWKHPPKSFCRLPDNGNTS